MTTRTLDDLEHDICKGAANLTAAEHAWLLLVAEFDRLEGYARWECQSCAAWLSRQIGLDIRVAHEKVRVARALERFSLISGAMARGELSYSKVRAVTRIATAETESALVDMALAGTSNHVERIVRAYRRADDVARATEQRQHDQRSLTHHIEDDGTVVIAVRLPTEPGLAVLARLERLTVAPRRGDDDTIAARRADALVELAEGCNDSPRYLVTLHAGDGRCEITTSSRSTDQIAVAPETALRLSCDAFLDSPDRGRRTRVVQGRLRRALQGRDGGCRFPGCNRTARFDAHHIWHWTKGGPTDLDNLVSLCRWHHRRVHEGGWHVGGSAAHPEFVAPDGRVACTRTATGTAVPVERYDRSARDGRCRWLGESLDLDHALTALFSRERAGP